eukprot:CAMPEP_0172508870 /NCGR_PEP_ID=MMETSP1066-20121228/215598_1 /TAXON_ID=671091 /ORGANISM="Coscinodiscus wailesii, Strain CCMP2513" /LENGTH=256 /DNA_ID=CAMNT_0013287077 /DNA_START=171 /DNA_END=938 /DNA_ORIENTATION=+
MKELTYRDYRTNSNGAGYNPSYPTHRKQEPDGVYNLTLKVSSCSPRVFEIRNFLSSKEADHLVDLAQTKKMLASTTNSGPDLNGEEDSNIRSSTNTWIYRETDAVVDAIYRRAADVLRVDEALLRHRDAHEHTELKTDHSIAEALQLVHYGQDQEYTAHHDFHYGKITDRFQPSRFATLLLYLNGEESGLEGGDSVFPRAVTADSHAGVSVIPQKGKAVLFYNMLPDGNVDDLSQHAGGSVVKGEKWLANLWVWDP